MVNKDMRMILDHGQNLSTSIIDITQLERESRKYLYLGLVVGVLMHLAAAPFITYSGFEEAQRETQDIRRMKTELIVLPPATANPYEDWEKELTPRPYIRKEFRPVQPSAAIPLKQPGTRITLRDGMEIINTGEATQELIHMLAAREDSLIREMYPDPRLELPYPDLAISREPEDYVPMIGEFISFDDIDALGKYKAFVVRDHTDLQKLSGFFHIPQFIRADAGQGFNSGPALKGLSEAFNYYTGLELKLDGPMDLTSRDLLEYPVIYLALTTRCAFELTEAQASNLRSYIENGGFIIFDNGRPWNEWTPAKATLLTMLTRVFGESLDFRQIPYTSPVWYCFFEFEGLPPEGAENWQDPITVLHDYPEWGNLLHNPDIEKIRQQTTISPGRIWGIWQNERLVAIYSDKGYCQIWMNGIIGNEWRDFYAFSDEKYNFNPQLKLGVNMLVYALLQEGGIAHRLSDYSIK